MRITIGHILILAGIGGYFALNTPGKWDGAGIQKKITDLTGHVGSLMQLFKSGAQPTPVLSSKNQNGMSAESKTAEALLDVNEAVNQKSVDGNGSDLPVTAAPLDFKPAGETVVDPKPIASAPVVKKKTTKMRRSKKAVAAKVPVKAVSSNDALVGTYVALTLDSGREVKGILEERTATAYKIQLPGMGPFTYQASKVVSIKPAQ